MDQQMEPFAALAQRAKQKAQARVQAMRIVELVAEIDALSGEMGSADFRDAVRVHGYDIDACLLTLGRRGANYNN